MDTLKTFTTAMVDGANVQNLDVDLILSFVSEDFESLNVGDKEDLHTFLEMNKSMIESAGGGFEIDLSEVKLEEDEGVVTAYPIYMIPPLGTATATIVIKQADDGVWRIVEMTGS